MERRESSKYLKVASRLSSSKFSSSSVARNNSSRATTTFSNSSKPSQNLKHSKSSKPFPRTSHHTTHYIAHKHSTKMSTTSKINPLKRPHEEDDTRPFKKIIETVEGLEEGGTDRIASSVTTTENHSYLGRRKPTYKKLLEKKRAMARKVRRDWRGMPASAQKGMVNLTGAICYRLSLFQAFLHQPKFVHFVCESHSPEQCVSDSRDTCVTCILRLLILAYWGGSQDFSGTSKVLRVMDTLFTTLGWLPDSPSGHADPDEQIAWLFGRMSAELPSTIFSCLEAILQPGQSTAICCGACGHESRTSYHRDTVLAVPILPAINGGQGTLPQYLQRYMSEELDDYRCDGCEDKVSTKHRKQVVDHGPEVLMVSLKRTDMYGRKLNTPVVIDSILDLSAYRGASTQGDLKYELSAVIKHRGTTTVGHYICSTKGPDGRWVEFNDKSKTNTSLSQAVSSKKSFTPYILFFQRKGE